MFLAGPCENASDAHVLTGRTLPVRPWAQRESRVNYLFADAGRFAAEPPARTYRHHIPIRFAVTRHSFGWIRARPAGEGTLRVAQVV